MKFKLYRIKDSARSSSTRLVERIIADEHPSSWGVFPGLFGLATNELYWVLSGEDTGLPEWMGEFEIVSQTSLTATVRPQDFVPRTTPGIYVFRWFQVDRSKIDEVVRLSNEAWRTFEGGFDTEVQGLFEVKPDFTVGEVDCAMLLVTWYRDLSVWQDSRAPDPEARERFIARQQLLDSAVPIATRLETHHV